MTTQEHDLDTHPTGAEAGHEPAPSRAAEVDIVIPSTFRPSLLDLLDSLPAGEHRPPGRIIVVDDRPEGRGGVRARPAGAGLDGDDIATELATRHPAVEVVRSGGRGPAAARNLGWRTASAPWVAFLDDDVQVTPDWGRRLTDELVRVAPEVAGVQGRLEVPLPADRPLTDAERNVAGLARAQWITADLVYRRAALEQVEGFDERFPRAYREDADLALRLARRGWRIEQGDRRALHPVPTAPWWSSLVKQAGNIDDALMTRLHGRDWRVAAAAPAGRFPWHLATTLATAGAFLAATRRHRFAQGLLGATAVGLTADLIVRRVAPGPRDRSEVLAMTATSVVLPHVAVVQRLRGEVRARRLVPRRPTPEVAR